MKPSYERMREIMLAGAMGDAFGYVIEFATTGYRKKIKAAQIMRGIVDTSDDTQMTLMNAMVLASFGEDTAQVNARTAVVYRNWDALMRGAVSPITAMDEYLAEHRAPGTTCMRSIGQMKSVFVDIREQGRLTDAQAENGSGGIMRVAPFLYYAAHRGTMNRMISDNTRLTHNGHLQARLSVAFVNILSDLVGGESISGCVSRHCSPYDIVAIEQIRKRIITDGYERALDGKAWDAMSAFYAAMAVYMTIPVNASFDDLLWAASAHSGDSDTLASICAQMWAAAGRDTHSNEVDVTKLDAYPHIMEVVANMYGVNTCTV